MEDIQVKSRSELANLTIKDLFFKYIRFLPLLILSVGLALTASYLYLRYSTLIYRSSGSLLIRDEKTAGGSSNDKFEQILTADSKKNIQNEIELLKSQPLMEKVVRALDLNFSYFAIGNIKELNIYKGAPFKLEAIEVYDSAGFELSMDFEDGDSFHFTGESTSISFGQTFKNRHGIFRVVKRSNNAINRQCKVKYQPTPSVASALLGDLVIAPKQGTGILVLTMESTNPELAADVVNKLMDVYAETTIEDRNTTTLQTLDFINARLSKVSREVDSITQRKLSFQQANNIIAPDEQTTNYLTQIQETDKELTTQRIWLNTAEQIDDYIRNRRFDATPTPSSLGLDDPTLNQLVAGYNQAQLERKALLENAPPGNVAVLQKEEELNELRKKISENLGNVKAAYRSSIASIQGKSNAALLQVRTLPAKSQMLVEIERDLQSKLRVYAFLDEKREETSIKLASTISGTKVLTPAEAVFAPVKPNRRNTHILAVLVGLLLPALGIFIVELLNDKITTRGDIERFTNAPIISEIGHSYSREALVVTNNSRSVVAEQFRILRSNLQYVINNVKKPVILITSSFSGEGKSFISTNVGAVMALTGKKTIVLEFDIRKPKVLSHLGLGKHVGLTNYLLGKATLAELPIQVPGNENLFVLACGPVPPNPAEILLDEKLETLFTYLQEQFDVVIIDTAPVGMVSDAMTLGKFANATLYIVRQGHTYKKQVGLIQEFLEQNKLPRIAVVLNDVKIRSGYGYYGYGRYGYGKGYTSGYFEDESLQEPSFLEKWFGWMKLNTSAKNKNNKIKQA